MYGHICICICIRIYRHALSRVWKQRARLYISVCWVFLLVCRCLFLFCFGCLRDLPVHGCCGMIGVVARPESITRTARSGGFSASTLASCHRVNRRWRNTPRRHHAMRPSRKNNGSSIQNVVYTATFQTNSPQTILGAFQTFGKAGMLSKPRKNRANVPSFIRSTLR